MHDDLKKYEAEIEGCKVAREWLDYYGKACDGRGDHVSTLGIDTVALNMTVPSGWALRYSPVAVNDAVRDLLKDRWPELSMAVRVAIDKREADARNGMLELGKKLVGENG